MNWLAVFSINGCILCQNSSKFSVVISFINKDLSEYIYAKALSVPEFFRLGAWFWGKNIFVTRFVTPANLAAPYPKVFENGVNHDGNIINNRFNKPKIITHGTSVIIPAVLNWVVPQILFVKDKFIKYSPITSNNTYIPKYIFCELALLPVLYFTIEYKVVIIKNHNIPELAFAEDSLI